MDEPTVEETDVEGYSEGSNVLDKAKKAVAGPLAGLVGLAGVACAGNPAPDSGPSMERTTERYEGTVQELGYNVAVEITYRGEEDDAIHLPPDPDCERAEVELDQQNGLESVPVSYVEFTDFDCDRDFERAHFRDTRDERRYYSNATLREQLQQSAWYAAAAVVTDGEWNSIKNVLGLDSREEIELIDVEPERNGVE